MILRLPSISRLLAGFLILATVLPAQEAGQGEGLTPEQIKAMRVARGNLDVQAEGQKDTDGDAKWQAMTPEERLNAGMRRGSQAHCQFVAACRPPKLLPGQSGTLMITAILKGAAVLPAPLDMIMTPRVIPGQVAVGALAARPALPGTIAKAYLGRPVYENTAVFEVPVTMGPEAKLGQKQEIAVDLQFDIFHGDSGQTVGRFLERVSAQVEVAPNIDPAVSGRVGKPKIQVEAVPITGDATEQPAVGAGSPDSVEPAMGGMAADAPVSGAEPDQEVVPATSSGNALPPTVAEEAGMPWMLVAGGGVFLLVIVMLLMRKK